MIVMDSGVLLYNDRYNNVIFVIFRVFEAYNVMFFWLFFGHFKEILVHFVKILDFFKL